MIRAGQMILANSLIRLLMKGKFNYNLIEKNY